MHTHVIKEAHTSPAFRHPGVSRMLEVVSRKYWWPKMADSVKAVVQLCSVCAKTKGFNQQPAGKWMPLPTPNRPWSHVAIDFVMDLPVSQGYTITMVVVDRLSKGCGLVLFSSLLSALKVAKALFQHVFHCYSIPEEILPDRGPQFI